MRLQAINSELSRLREETENEGVDNSAREMYYIGVIVRMLLIFDPVAADLSRVSLPEKNSRDGWGLSQGHPDNLNSSWLLA